MFAFLAPNLLLARTQDLRGMSEGFRSRDMNDQAFEALLIIGGLLAVCITLLLIGRYARRFERLKSYDNAPELFRELCRVHGLGWPSRRLLKRLAADWEMSNPALLFVEPERFDTSRLSADWHGKALDLDHIRKQLFDTP